MCHHFREQLDGRIGRAMAAEDIYQKLVTLLDERGATYRVIEHDPEGVTEVVSRLRGHDPGQAAKCIIIMVKIGKKVTRFVAAVLPGDPITMLIETVPLYLLYEVGVLLASISERRAARRAEQNLAARGPLTPTLGARAR
jgi:Ala-tRNA(Pro) deacylase